MKRVWHGSNVKVGISISRELAEEADALAREMGVTRSGLYAMALRDFIRRRCWRRWPERYNDRRRDSLGHAGSS